MATTEFGGMTFVNDAFADYVISDLTGWLDGAPIRPEIEQRPNSDGAFGVDTDYRAARVISQTGVISGSTPFEAETRWAQFAALQADGKPFTFAGTTARGRRTCLVSVSGAPTITPITDRDARYSVTMIARDPVRYMDPVTQSTALPSAGGGLEYPLHGSSGTLSYGAVGTLGRVTLSNPGTADTYAKVTVSGGLEGGALVTVIETGQALTYTRVIPAGSTVSVDGRTGEVLIDGVSDGSTWLIGDPSILRVPALDSRTLQFTGIGAPSGAPMMTTVHAPGDR